MVDTISNTDLLKEKALTVRLTRKKPARNAMDKALSEELQKLKGVEDKASLRVNKSLFPKEASKAYQDSITEAGKYFYKMTTPWDDKGWRLLSIEVYKDFIKVMKSHTRRFREAALEFINALEANIELMRPVLKDAFSLDDYGKFINVTTGKVNVEAVKDMFVLEVEYGTVADADDLRACLTEDDREVIAHHITKKNNEKFAKSQEHIIGTLHTAILAIHERLSVDENIFRDTLIENLNDLCDLIPKMNIANDDKINQLAADAKRTLCHWEPSVLRDDMTIRSDVADEAEKMLGNMKGLI